MNAEHASEFGHLDEVALTVVYGQHGDFLNTFVDAWLRADVWNKRILRPAWEALIEKYDLVRDLERDRARRALEG